MFTKTSNPTAPPHSNYNAKSICWPRVCMSQSILPINFYQQQQQQLPPRPTVSLLLIHSGCDKNGLLVTSTSHITHKYHQIKPNHSIKGSMWMWRPTC